MARFLSICLFLMGLGSVFLAPSRVSAAEVVVKYWYHIDNSRTDPLPELAARFQEAHPDITVSLRSIPTATYYSVLRDAVASGDTGGGDGREKNLPDAAMVRRLALPGLLSRNALEPLDPWLEKWDGYGDILGELWEKLLAPDGKRYCLPLQFVVSYLYIRKDLFDQYNVKIPTNRDEFLAAAKALTLDVDGDGKTDVYGFGMRGGRGALDHWGVFVLPKVEDLSPEQLESEDMREANRFFLDLALEHRVVPPDADKAGYQEILDDFRNGRTAMTIHHIGSAALLEKELGDRVTAIPVPKCGGKREGWTAFGDEENAVFAHGEKAKKEAAWKWISFLSEGEANVHFVTGTGQLPVTKSGLRNRKSQGKRFLDATLASFPYAHMLPLRIECERLSIEVLPKGLGEALRGEIDADALWNRVEQTLGDGK